MIDVFNLRKPLSPKIDLPDEATEPLVIQVDGQFNVFFDEDPDPITPKNTTPQIRTPLTSKPIFFAAVNPRWEENHCNSSYPV
jgi:hypothetical protein